MVKLLFNCACAGSNDALILLDEEDSSIQIKNYRVEFQFMKFPSVEDALGLPIDDVSCLIIFDNEQQSLKEIQKQILMYMDIRKRIPVMVITSTSRASTLTTWFNNIEGNILMRPVWKVETFNKSRASTFRLQLASMLIGIMMNEITAERELFKVQLKEMCAGVVIPQ